MEVNNICKDCIKLGNGCNGTTNPVWTGCVLRVTVTDISRLPACDILIVFDKSTKV